jgi:hypothetical protein
MSKLPFFFHCWARERKKNSICSKIYLLCKKNTLFFFNPFVKKKWFCQKLRNNKIFEKYLFRNPSFPRARACAKKNGNTKKNGNMAFLRIRTCIAV